MAESIYEAGDVQGYDFAFDAAGKIIDWEPVAQEAQERRVKLTLSLGMLFPVEGKVAENANLNIAIPKGSSSDDIKRAVYAGIRGYVGRVKERLLSREADEDAEEEETLTYTNSVALLSSVSMS
jgi:hypothetical protein